MAFRWAILGAGSIAGKFADAVRRTDGCEVVAVASRSAERAERFANSQGIPHSFGDYAEMLRRVKPDAAYVAVTTNAHAALSRLCIEQGVPVLCEKAMFQSLNEAQQTLQLARSRGVFAMEAMWSRMLPAVKEMKRVLDAGIIGDVRFAEFAIGWKAPSHPGNRFHDPAAGGGAAYDLLVYGYELAEYFLGEPDGVDVPSVIFGESGVDVTETVTLRYPGCLARLDATILTNLPERAVLCGTKGRLEMIRPHMAEGFTVVLPDGTTHAWHDDETQNGFVYEVQEVMRCVAAGLTESPEVPHSLTLRCAALFDRIMPPKD